VQTLSRVVWPSTLARTGWRLGFHTFLVRIWEWLTFMPTDLPLPQISHWKDICPPPSGALPCNLSKKRGKTQEEFFNYFQKRVAIVGSIAYDDRVVMFKQNIQIDIDDGVKKNYEIFADIVAKI
jgi:hypothetical protein